MLFTGKNLKIHIFKLPNLDKTYCGLDKFWIGTIGHWCCLPNKKRIKYYGKCICQKCLKSAQKRRNNLDRI